MKTISAAMFLVLSGVLTSNAALTIADWTFEGTAPSGTAASETYGAADSGVQTSGSSASGVHASSSTWSSPAGNGSAQSFSANTWAVNDYYQFAVSTLGFLGIAIQWDQTGSATGPSDFVLQYSLTANSGYTQIGSDYTILVSTWSSSAPKTGFTYAPDLSGIAALIANQTTIYFRLVDKSTTAINNSPVATTGTDRVDNFIVSGNAIGGAVPEPSTWCAGAFLGVGLLGSFIRNRRK